ncbi:sperm microtubule inner protein 6 [Apteryx mantelli]|uniref:Sperm microtubule inner protein 6 n=1 Tax=Apteryx mantelli TaxID=2696672 RepID=A0ABM4G5R7_9AVES
MRLRQHLGRRRVPGPRRDSRPASRPSGRGTMFLFAQGTQTPISTCTDSYRPPGSVKKTFQEPPSLLWKENKFVTKGLAMPPAQNPASQGQQEKLMKAAVREYTYRNAIDPTAYPPQKYWVTRQEERYNPLFVTEDRHVTWRTAPYDSAAGNKCTTRLPRLPQVGPAAPHGLPACCQCPPKPEQLDRRERDVVAAVLDSVSGRQLPSLQPRTIFISSPRWDTSHFRKAGGARRGSYTIHPEFVSESCSAPLC